MSPRTYPLIMFASVVTNFPFLRQALAIAITQILAEYIRETSQPLRMASRLRGKSHKRFSLGVR